jgi:hypothetical protein
MLGFQTTPGDGGRERAARGAWLEVTKLQTLAARQVAKELKLRSVWSWGWGVWSKGEDDPDKPAAACVYLWAREPKLCGAPAIAGAGFNASRTEGQLVFPAGARCTLYGHRIDEGAISSLTRVTGDRDVAFTAVFARVVASLTASVTAKQVALAERAAVSRLGSYARYRAALARAHAAPATARGVIADELRRAQIESRLRVDSPSAPEVRDYYSSYGETPARLVETKTPAPWLGNAKRGIALASHAPPQVFTIPQGRWVKVRAMLGTYRVRALRPAVPLGTVPLGLARRAIVSALKSLARGQRYEDWLLGRERALVAQAVCRRDTQPAIGVVPLTDYLPFLAVE